MPEKTPVMTHAQIQEAILRIQEILERLIENDQIIFELLKQKD